MEVAGVRGGTRQTMTIPAGAWQRASHEVVTERRFCQS
jgi:hypothetical protein